MFFRKLVALVFVIAFGASCALAQDSFLQKIEVTPFVGAKVGGKINVAGNTTDPTIDNLLIKSSIDYGGIFDYSLFENFQVEAMWDHQPSAISAHHFGPGVPAGREVLTNTNLDTVTFGANYAFRGESKVRPFIAGGLGWTHFTNTNDPNNVDLGFSNKFAYNIGGGLKYYFSKFAGFRFDLRYLGTRTTPGQTVECSAFLGECFQVATTNHANQMAANLGLILRF